MEILIISNSWDMMADNNIENKDNDQKEEKIEVCYTCGKEFDMNSDEGAHYHYGKYPMCGYCSNFYGFYKEDLMDKK